MVALGIVIGYKMNERDEVPLLSQSAASSVGTGRVEQVIRYIEAKYVDSVNADLLVESAIKEVIEALDPHSAYIAPDDLTAIDRQIGGRYIGIGAESLPVDDTLHVRYIYEGSTAADLDIRPFDRILAIDDKTFVGPEVTQEDLARHLGKLRGEEVTLTLYRPSANETIKLPFVVQEQQLKTITAVSMMDSLCGYIRIDRFSNNTYEDFMTGLERLIRDHRARHLVIDVRDNPGGLLVEAVDILSQLFVEKGNMLVYTQDKNGRENKYKSTGKPFFPIDKIAIVVNENSASSSEILAGAIQDWDRGVIVGRRTFGKGLIQDQYRLSNQSAIRLTTARYYTPSGRSIQRKYDAGNGGIEYGDDWYNRYESGELFFKDSVAVDDSMRYETMRYRRTIRGGGGITPDIFVGLDTIDVSLHQEKIDESVATIAYQYASTYGTTLPDDVTQYITDWRVPGGLVVQLQDKLGRDRDPALFSNLDKTTLDQWSTSIKHEIGAIKYGPEQVDYLRSLDVEVIAARDYLISDLELIDL
jgi:carboxyl-terminal processing protease